MRLQHSYSTLNLFKTCPRQFYEKHIARTIKFEQNEAAKWGSEVHEALERYFANTGPASPLTGRFSFLHNTAKAVSRAAALDGSPIQVERAIAVDENMAATDFRRGHLRGKQDLFYKLNSDPRKAVLLDWKVVKKPDPRKYALELDVFCYLSFAVDPEIKTIKTGLIWLHQDAPRSPDIKTCHRRDLSRLSDNIFSLIRQVEDANSAGLFPERRSGLCNGWCPVTTCNYYTPRS